MIRFPFVKSLLFVACLAQPAGAQTLTVEELAEESALGPIGLFPDATTEIAPVMASNGTTAFLSKPAGGKPAAFYVVAPSFARYLALPGSYTNVRSLRINAGQLVFVADRTGTPIKRGVYRVSVTALKGTKVAVPDSTKDTLIKTVFEMSKSSDANAPYLRQFVALSPNGTAAFSTMVNGKGAIYRGPITGTVVEFQKNPDVGGLVFNNREIDVNDAGQVAVEAEYNDPAAGLCRGVLVFNNQNESAATVQAAVSRLGVGSHAYFRLGNGGKLVLHFATAATAASLGLTIQPGIYLANLTSLGLVPNSTIVTQIGATATFTSVSRWDFDGISKISIEGSRQNPTASGLFLSSNGAAPSTVPFIRYGDVINGRRISWHRMGQLNACGKQALFISDFNTTNRFLWRVSGF
jgi:hypothetical protein